MSPRPLSQLWESIADRGREILAARRGAHEAANVERLCHELLSEQGEAAGTALARELAESYGSMDGAQRLAFFELLRAQYSPDVDEVLRAAEAYRASPSADALIELTRAVEPPRQELLRRINMAPAGTATIVAMRGEILGLLKKHPELRTVEEDLRHLLRSWFNRGFLVLERIDWRTPAATLEKLIAYEAVHEIKGWDDMRRRLAADRRCFAFFHPALPEEPVIFVEVALLPELAAAVGPLLDSSGPVGDARDRSCAIFYSINNCQAGLKGISFGSFLIKQVVSELVDEDRRVRRFATLSPAPGFRPWLAGLTGEERAGLAEDEQTAVAAIEKRGWHRDEERAEPFREPLLRLCARYLLTAKSSTGEPDDAVARFHLGNGASIERLNWRADLSAKGLRQSAGIMVNYAYRPHRIERNHEAYVHHGRIAAAGAVRSLARKPQR